MVSGNILDMFYYGVALRLSEFTGIYKGYIFVAPIPRAVKNILEKVSHKNAGMGFWLLIAISK